MVIVLQIPFIWNRTKARAQSFGISLYLYVLVFLRKTEIQRVSVLCSINHGRDYTKSLSTLVCIMNGTGTVLLNKILVLSRNVFTYSLHNGTTLLLPFQRSTSPLPRTVKRYNVALFGFQYYCSFPFSFTRCSLSVLSVSKYHIRGRHYAPWSEKVQNDSSRRHIDGTP